MNQGYGGGVALVVGALMFGFGATAATAATLLPHRAAYELALVPETQSDLAALRGALVIEWEATCELWLSHQRMAFVAMQLSGENFRHDVRYGSAEARDGSSLRFTVRSYDGQDLAEEYRGEANVQADGSAVASFSTPEAKRVELPIATTFPTAHLEDVLRRAARGERFVTHQVFDGWGYDALTQVTTVIGGRKAGPIGQGDQADAGWPVSMAYYDLEPTEEGNLPSFEATFLLSSNGVLHDLKLNYGDFAVDAELSELQLYQPPDC